MRVFRFTTESSLNKRNIQERRCHSDNVDRQSLQVLDVENKSLTPYKYFGKISSSKGVDAIHMCAH